MSRFLCLAVVIAAGLVLTSCNGGEPPAATEPAATPAAPPGGLDTSGVSAPAAPDPAVPAPPETPAALEPIDWPEPPAALPEGAPLITFASMEHHYGAISDAGTYTGTFRFKNIGSGLLQIRNVRTACGCTVPELDKNEYEPGEEGVLRVVLDPSNRKGGLTKYLFMLSNSAANSRAKLLVTADITPLVRFDSLFLRYGIMALGRPHERSFSVYFTDPALEFTELTVDNPHVSAQLLQRSTRPQPGPDGRGEYRAVFGMTIAQTAPWGTLDPGRLTFTARGSRVPGEAPRSAQYTMFISAQLFGDLQADPTALSTDESLRLGETFNASLVLSSASGTYFAVVDASLAEPSDQDCEVQVEPIDPTSYRISIACTPLAKGPISGKVRVQTDVPGEEDLTLPFFGYVK